MQPSVLHRLSNSLWAAVAGTALAVFVGACANGDAASTRGHSSRCRYLRVFSTSGEYLTIDLDSVSVLSQGVLSSPDVPVAAVADDGTAGEAQPRIEWFGGGCDYDTTRGRIFALVQVDTVSDEGGEDLSPGVSTLVALELPSLRTQGLWRLPSRSAVVAHRLSGDGRRMLVSCARDSAANVIEAWWRSELHVIDPQSMRETAAWSDSVPTTDYMMAARKPATQFSEHALSSRDGSMVEDEYDRMRITADGPRLEPTRILQRFLMAQRGIWGASPDERQWAQLDAVDGHRLVLLSVLNGDSTYCALFDVSTDTTVTPRPIGVPLHVPIVAARYGPGAVVVDEARAHRQPDGRWRPVATGVLAIYETSSGRLLRKVRDAALEGDPYERALLGVSPDGRWAAVSTPGRVVVARLDEPTTVRAFKTEMYLGAPPRAVFTLQ
jgi:hypothetical protein